MAEQVQAMLDQMVAPLRDLMDRGIFSQSEIRAIVSRRRESEYLLHRRVARKADFLRYIDAEMSLEKLRAIRTRQVLARQARAEKEKKNDSKKEKSSKSKQHIGDAHIVAHIHFLFTRMLRKFRADVSLHLQHAAFAKESKSFTRLGRIYSEALQVHPRNVELWIEAASLEFFGHLDQDKRVGGGSIQNARVLFQRGLRVNPTCQDLWLQYFCLEFHHIQKLRGRREILQLDNDKNDEGEESAEPQDDPDGQLLSQAPIATVVYKNAVKAIPDDVTFRLKFLNLLRLFPQTDAVESVIMKSIQEDFQEKPDAWIARATFAVEQKQKQLETTGGETNGAQQVVAGFTTDLVVAHDADLPPRKKQRGDPQQTSDNVIAELQEATRQIPSCEMYLQSVQFARSYMEQLAQGEVDGETESMPISKSLEEARSFVEQMLVKASEPEMITCDVVMEHADYLVSNGRLEDAANKMESFLNHFDATSDNANTLLWLNLARLVEELEPPRPAAQVLQTAMKRIPMRDSGHMVVMLELFATLLQTSLPTIEEEQAKQKEELSDLFQRLLLLSPGPEYRKSMDDDPLTERSVADASLQYLRHTMDTDGISAARKIYSSLFQSNYCQSSSGKGPDEVQVMKELFDDCIKLEKSSASGKKAKARKERKNRLRRIYEVAISFFQDEESSLADSYRQGLDEDVRFGL